MPKLITAKCQTCGKESEVEWTLGMKCPACGSPKFFPMVFIDKSASRGGQKAARSTSRKPVGLILTLILLVGGVSLFAYRLKKTSGQKEYSTTVTMSCTNEDCTNPNPLHLFRKKLSTKNVFPHIKCPFCKQMTAYRAVRCRTCGEIFALETEGKKNPTLDLVCPNCGSSDIDFDSSSIPLTEEEEK